MRTTLGGRAMNNPTKLCKKTRVLRSDYEAYLNDIYTAEQAKVKGEYMAKAARLLEVGRYGTALRKYDPIAFEVGFNEYKANQKYFR